MDVGGLRIRIQSTLDPIADIRRQAELDLKYVRCLPREDRQSPTEKHCQAEEQPGFINALLDILQAEHDPGVRLPSIDFPNGVSTGDGRLSLHSRNIPEEPSSEGVGAAGGDSPA
jgi:hypothetical protein